MINSATKFHTTLVNIRLKFPTSVSICLNLCSETLVETESNTQ